MSNCYSSVITNVSNFLDRETFFSASISDGRLIVSADKQSTPLTVFDSIFRLSEYAKSDLQSKNLSQLTSSEKMSYRHLVDVIWRSSKCFSKRFGGVAKELARDLSDCALQLKLGARVSILLLNRPEYSVLKEFILANHLHHKMEAVGYQMGAIPSIEVDGIEGPIDWTKITCRSEASIGKDFKAFYLDDRLLFKTDNNLVLVEDYSFLNGKIALYNPWNDEHLRPYDKEASTGKCKIELWTALVDKKGRHPPLAAGDHSFLVLVSEQGQRFGVGKLGLGVLGYNQGYIECPDRYLLLPSDSHSFQKTEFPISKQGFNDLIASIEKDKRSNVAFDMFNENCTSFVAGVLSRAGIQVEYKLHLLEIFIRQLLPQSFVDRALTKLKKLPRVLQKALFFLPFIYLPIVAVGLGICLLKWKAFSSNRNELNLLDVFFRPWAVQADHPFALRQWQSSHHQFVHALNTEDAI